MNLVQINVDTIQDILGFCQCGMPENAQKFLTNVLEFLEWRRNKHCGSYEGKEWDQYCKEIDDERKRIFGSNGQYWFICYVLDWLGLVEHGGAVPGWLSEKGQDLLNKLKMVESLHK